MDSFIDSACAVAGTPAKRRARHSPGWPAPMTRRASAIVRRMGRLRLHTLPALTALACAAAGCATLRAGAGAANEAVGEPAARNAVAELALERGDCRTAAETYAQAVRDGTVTLARRATEVALACEHLPAAWQAVRRWQALDPQDRDAASIQAVVALKLHRLRDARRAVDRSASLAAEAERSQRLAELTAMLLEEADGAAVLSAVSGALGTPQAAQDLALLADLALKAFDFRRAQDYAEQALAREPGSVPAQRVLARVRVLQNDPAAAMALARSVMQADPQGGAFELAEILVALDRLEEARRELERLRASEESAAEADRRLALLAFQGGDFPEAQRRFAELALRGEAREAALFYLADIAARYGDADSALAGFRRLADSPLAVAARSRAAAILLKRSDRAEALTLLDDYAAAHPERSFELTLAKAHVLSEAGDSESGLALLATALERHPQHPVLQYERAVMLERAGRVKESIAAFEQLLAERPEDPTLMNALGYTLADHGLELPRAEALIREALETTPDHPAVLDSLGWVRFRRGDIAGALPILERAYSIARDPEIAAHWGEALWVSGRQQEARGVWATALARSPDSEPLKATLARLLGPGPTAP